MFGITSEIVIIVVSALAASASFAAFALPFLNKNEKKDHYHATISKKKKDLFTAAKESNAKKGDKSLSAKDSVATLFKMEQMAGKLGERARDQLLQAGIRSPKAPMTYLLIQAILPLILVVLSMLVLSAAEQEISDGMKFFVIAGALFVGFFLPRLIIKNAAIKRQQELNFTFPDALDIMLICVQGGIGLEQTVERVAEEVAEHSPVLAEELGILSAEMAMLSDRRAALSDFGRRVGGHGKSFATALIQAEQYGTSVSAALRVIASELRDIRMANAEQKAASLPPKLTVPMIVFFLPALFVVILGPAALQAVAAGLGG